MQLSFHLAEIDREKTKDVVEQALEKYRIYILSVPEERMPKVTQTFSFVPPTNTNAFHSSTEDAGIHNVDYEQERFEYISKIQKAVNRLTTIERSILINRYMQQEDVFDYEVYNDMSISEKKYYRFKSRAFYKLAFALKIEIYKEDAVNDRNSTEK